MTVRSVIISFFILSFSFGMTVTNQINSEWSSTHSGKMLIPYHLDSFKNYSEINIPTDRAGYNNSLRDITTFNKPNDISFNFDFFQNLKYGSMLVDLLFNSVWGFPAFLQSFGMPWFFVIPLSMFLVLNHILAAIYIVTGRTFIY
jgi:hypothetical protein